MRIEEGEKTRKAMKMHTILMCSLRSWRVRRHLLIAPEIKQHSQVERVAMMRAEPMGGVTESDFQTQPTEKMFKKLRRVGRPSGVHVKYPGRWGSAREEFEDGIVILTADFSLSCQTDQLKYFTNASVMCIMYSLSIPLFSPSSLSACLHPSRTSTLPTSKSSFTQIIQKEKIKYRQAVPGIRGLLPLQCII
jgi:hypothetical protein